WPGIDHAGNVVRVAGEVSLSAVVSTGSAVAAICAASATRSECIVLIAVPPRLLMHGSPAGAAYSLHMYAPADGALTVSSLPTIDAVTSPQRTVNHSSDRCSSSGYSVRLMRWLLAGRCVSRRRGLCVVRASVGVRGCAGRSRVVVRRWRGALRSCAGTRDLR